MFTADGKPSDDDPRENGPRLGDESVTLVESLRRQRLTLEMKCSGLDAEAMARRSVEPSTMSLLGLVRHLTDGERLTFRVMMAGQDVPRLFGSGDGDFDGAVPDPRWLRRHGTHGCGGGLRHAVRGRAAQSRRYRRRSLDRMAAAEARCRSRGAGQNDRRVHRHMGHADLLRERINGA